ncbi:hypothetical protein MRX96_022736 [Rhipicephalus microplus]
MHDRPPAPRQQWNVAGFSHNGRLMPLLQDMTEKNTELLRGRSVTHARTNDNSITTVFGPSGGKASAAPESTTPQRGPHGAEWSLVKREGRGSAVRRRRQNREEAGCCHSLTRDPETVDLGEYSREEAWERKNIDRRDVTGGR